MDSTNEVEWLVVIEGFQMGKVNHIHNLKMEGHLKTIIMDLKYKRCNNRQANVLLSNAY